MTEAKTAIATVAPIRTGAPVLGIIPRSIEEVVRLSRGIAEAQLAPKGLESWPKIMAVIMGGAELGLPPMQSLQSFALINNKLSIWGDAIPALLRSRGFKIKEWYEGDGDALTAHCEVTRPDTGEVIPGEFSVADAKTAKLWTKTGPWQEYPKRMLKMRARSWAARDGAADVLRGVQVREEVADYQHSEDVTPPSAMLVLESQVDDSVQIEVIEGPPMPPVPVEPPGPEIVDAKIEATALKPSFAQGWAATWRERIADPDQSSPSLSAAWDRPANGAARDKARREDAALVEEVTAEVLGAIKVLEEA